MNMTPSHDFLPRTAIVELKEPRPSLSGTDIPAGTVGTVVGVFPAPQNYAVEVIFEGQPSVLNVPASLVQLSPQQVEPGVGLPAAPDEKRHYFAFTFGVLPNPDDATPRGEMDTVYLGFVDETVTPARINAARAECALSENAVLLTVNYFGYMTQDEFDVWN